MAELTYSSRVFRVANERAARDIILTREGGLATDERWERETPYLGELVTGRLELTPESVVIDFGCGIGRMAKELIERTGCHVLGVDLSPEMRALAPGYLPSSRFSVISPELLIAMVKAGVQLDAAISVWVLQHCARPVADIDLLYRALKSGGRFMMVNNLGRAVPTVEKFWANDGVDVRALIGDRFTEVETGRLDAAAVSQTVADFSFWGLYRK